ncbi:MAG TPA: hypothetical protein EYP57_04145 [Thermodesulfobacteriaceae bacterium]|nr:hypothetical protein [Thermodesulfobacteriaceae bacterium]
MKTCSQSSPIASAACRCAVSFIAQLSGLLRICMPVLFVLFLPLFFPSRAAAVQIHGPPEGLYVHQMAHCIFAAAMIFLIYLLSKYPPGKGTAWKYLKISLFFFFMWNINALIVHSLDVRLPDDALFKTADFWKNRLNPPLTLERWVYFVTKHDHFWCVTAMFFLVISLRSLCRDTEQKLTMRKETGKP